MPPGASSYSYALLLAPFLFFTFSYCKRITLVRPSDGPLLKPFSWGARMWLVNREQLKEGDSPLLLLFERTIVARSEVPRCAMQNEGACTRFGRNELETLRIG